MYHGVPILPGQSLPYFERLYLRVINEAFRDVAYLEIVSSYSHDHAPSAPKSRKPGGINRGYLFVRAYLVNSAGVLNQVVEGSSVARADDSGSGDYEI